MCKADARGSSVAAVVEETAGVSNVRHVTFRGGMCIIRPRKAARERAPITTAAKTAAAPAVGAAAKRAISAAEARTASTSTRRWSSRRSSRGSTNACTAEHVELVGACIGAAHWARAKVCQHECPRSKHTCCRAQSCPCTVEPADRDSPSYHLASVSDTAATAAQRARWAAFQP